MLIAGLV